VEHWPEVPQTTVYVFEAQDDPWGDVVFSNADAPPLPMQPIISEGRTIDVLSISSVDESFDPNHSVPSAPAAPWSLSESLSMLNARPSAVVIKQSLGSGAFAEVVLADYNGEQVAIKLFHEFSQDALRMFLDEVHMLRKFRHENIVAFRGILIDGRFGLIMEFLPGGSLFDYICRRDPLRATHEVDERFSLHWPIAQKMLTGAACGLIYLHGRRVIHRDIKSANLLLAADLTVKLADFGLSRTRNDLPSLRTITLGGSPAWMAPETFTQNPIDYKCDVYSFGVTMWELAYRSAPWSQLGVMQVMMKMMYYPNERPPLGDREHLDPLPTEYLPLMEECWSSDPAMRPDMATVHRRLLSMRVSTSLSLSEASCASTIVEHIPSPPPTVTVTILSPS
jgi:serine/threonine protein kinase